MSEISALAAANFLTQAALPLIQAAASHVQENPSLPSSNKDTVEISSEARTPHSYTD